MPALNDLIAFDGTDGNSPAGSLIKDAAGNLYGTTTFGGASNDGTVFELAATGAGYAATPTTLVSFDYTDGGAPYGSLIADATGNLYGTTNDGGAYITGTVFELAKTASGYAATPTTLASLNQSSGNFPEGSLLADAAGNLYGTASENGSDISGTVFELTKTASGYTTSVLAAFNGTNGDGPRAA